MHMSFNLIHCHVLCMSGYDAYTGYALEVRIPEGQSIILTR